MDTSRKTITDKHTCHFCMNYKPKYKGVLKLCRGHCKVTGVYKQRTDKCKKYFKEGLQIKLLEE